MSPSGVTPVAAPTAAPTALMTCSACDLSAGPFAVAEAALLATVHDQLHHGGARQADATRPHHALVA
jgi:hypothetical protein